MVVLVDEKQERKKKKIMLNNGVFQVGLNNVCMRVL